jgi:transposase-like protein
MSDVTVSEVARRVDVSPGTLRRWVRDAGGEVLVTREVVEAAGRRRAFERIGEVKLKGFDEAPELHLARRP